MDTVPHSALSDNFTVYALIDPRDYAVCYIGITDDVYRRFFQHLSCDGSNPAKDAWITELKQENVVLIMKTLERVETFEQARERETFWIQHYRFLGTPLFNQSIPSIRLPKHVTQRTLFKTHGANPNVGRKANNSKVKEIILYYYQHGTWPDGLSQDMRYWYGWFYFTVPKKGEKSYRGRGYKQHIRAYDRGQEWMKKALRFPIDFSLDAQEEEADHE